jgi:hypothetical protein
MLPKLKYPIEAAEWMYVIQCLDEWLQIRLRDENMIEQRLGNAPDLRTLITQLRMDIWHSALLRRMIVEGKDPLPESPPTEHSYPVYPD